MLCKKSLPRTEGDVCIEWNPAVKKERKNKLRLNKNFETSGRLLPFSCLRSSKRSCLKIESGFNNHGRINQGKAPEHHNAS